MRTTAIVSLGLSIILFSPVAEPADCNDEHTQMLSKILMHTISEYPELTLDAVKRYRLVITRATRPADSLVLQATCSILTQAMYESYGLEEMKRMNYVYEGCPEDTVELMLEQEQARNNPNSSDNDVSDYLPVVRVAPEYPKKALEKGLSGSVIVEFTVTSKGEVRRPKVTESTDKIFDKAALNSVKRFKYNPRRENGKPVATRGVATRITFTHPDDVRPNDCPEYGPPALLPDDELAILSLTPDSD